MLELQIYRSGERVLQDDNLSLLPNEVIQMLYEYLKEPDKTCLALTCKQHAETFEHVKRVDQKSKSSGSAPKERRLAVLVRLRDWVPPNLKLCYSCVKYLPRATRGQWGGDYRVAQNKLATKKAIRIGPRCAICVKKDQFESVGARADVLRMKKLIREI